MFLHAGTLHLLGNILALVVFGYILENGIGSGRFLILYLLAGLVASFLFIGIYPNSEGPLIGASGAIAGVTGACLIGFPTERAPLAYLIWLALPLFMAFMPPLIGFAFFTMVILPAIALTIGRTAPIFPFLLIWIMYQIYMGSAGIGVETGVAYWAHIGGFISGIILYLVLRRRGSPREKSEWESIPATGRY